MQGICETVARLKRKNAPSQLSFHLVSLILVERRDKLSISDLPSQSLENLVI
jgi:hypothetical protein